MVQTTRQIHEKGVTWKVRVDNHERQQSEHDFDYIVLASGFFSQARPLSDVVPRVTPESSIQMTHSSKFRSLQALLPPEQAAGKSILVIGGGNSAGEAAAAIAQQLSDAWYSPDQQKAQQYQGCKIVHVTPRPLYALPPFVPVNEDCNAYLPIDLKLYDLSKRPPGPITANAGTLNQAVKDMIHSSLQTTIGGDQSDLGAPALAIPSIEPRAAVHVALSEHYPEFVRSGVIQVLPGRIKSIDASQGVICMTTVQGLDAELEDVGAVLYATGYSPQPAIDFLPDDVKTELQYDPASFRLPLILTGWQTMTPRFPELSLIGFYEGPYWPIIEAQARFTAQRWLRGENLPNLNAYEQKEKLLALRISMKERSLDVPQYWFGDYLGYCEDPNLQKYLDLHRNDEPFGSRAGPVSPARYLSHDSDRSVAVSIMRDLHETWTACLNQGKFTARAAFRALHGNWNIHRTIKSALPTFPSGTLDGKASFHPRYPTLDKSGKLFDFEYLYVESGTLMLSNGASMPARRRYVYRYSEKRDELSVWFVKPDKDLEVDYHFHNLTFVTPIEAKQEGALFARADHLCVEDMYWTEYRLPIKGIALHEFETRHTVRGPSKDYINTTKFSRPSPADRSQLKNIS